MPDYAAIEVYSPLSRQWELMSDKGKVIVFDNAEVAWNWLPLLGNGRRYISDIRTLAIHFMEIMLDAPNRARVVSPYFPEEKMPWRRHRIWSEWMLSSAAEGMQTR